MTVYVDDMRLQATVGSITARWSHLTADTEPELHALAARIGLRRAWFQDDPDPLHRHYDVTDSKRRAAIAAGAVAETWREGANRRNEARAAARAGRQPPPPRGQLALPLGDPPESP